MLIEEYLKLLLQEISSSNKKENDHLGKTPKFIRSKCKSYGDCLDVCPVDAVSGNAKLKNIKIDLKKCIKCGACIDSCKAKAIIPM